MGSILRVCDLEPSVTLNRLRPICFFVHAVPVQGLELTSEGSGQPGWSLVKEILCFRHFGLIPRSTHRDWWFNQCMSHVRLSATVDPFLAASVWEPMKGCACHTGNSQQSSCFPYLNSHTVDIGAGHRHCFWSQAFFLQANDLLLGVAVSQADHGREWLAS